MLLKHILLNAFSLLLLICINYKLSKKRKKKIFRLIFLLNRVTIL